MEADTMGFPLLPQSRGLEETVATHCPAGARFGGHQSALWVIWYEEGATGGPPWKVSAVAK